MIIAIVLSLIGLVLIYLEFFLPGGIFTVGGILLLVSSIVMLFLEKIPIAYLLTYVAILVCLVFVVMKFALKKLKSSKNIFLNSDQEGYKACAFEKELIGKIGIAHTDLRPSGKIFINDVFYSATSKENYIEKGSKIQVIAGEGANLIVKKHKGEEKLC